MLPNPPKLKADVICRMSAATRFDPVGVDVGDAMNPDDGVNSMTAANADDTRQVQAEWRAGWRVVRRDADVELMPLAADWAPMRPIRCTPTAPRMTQV